MNYLFDRLCKLNIGKIGEVGLSLDQNLKIEFEITKSVTPTTHYNSVRVFNLSDSSIQQITNIIDQNKILIKNHNKVLTLNLYVGYAQSSGLELLYIGHVSNLSTRITAPDTITEFLCAEGTANFKNNFISLGFNAGVSAKQVLKGIAKQLFLDIDNASDIEDRNFAHGYSIFGTGKESLSRFTKQINSYHTIEKDKIRLVRKGKYTLETVVFLSSSSGMIGSPERIDTSGDDAESSDVKHGWKIMSLMNAQLLPGRRVRIESKELSGTFIIDSVVHRGNTKDGDWISEIEIKTEV